MLQVPFTLGASVDHIEQVQSNGQAISMNFMSSFALMINILELRSHAILLSLCPQIDFYRIQLYLFEIDEVQLHE